MHFLSDVSVSSLLTIALGAVAVWLFYFNKPFFNKIWAFASGDPKASKEAEDPGRTVICSVKAAAAGRGGRLCPSAENSGFSEIYGEFATFSGRQSRRPLQRPQQNGQNPAQTMA